ncbi:uncharacterized protein [Paramisgurnus dabryanus]|uniref:uncharacterized protein n=1 Tax=Paramisgurnus dabryanus TaxID=90735 RepID=UPI0031F3DDFB
MFAVVNFPNEDDSLAVVSKTWCTTEGCYWPRYKSHERLKKAVLSHEQPDPDTWEVHKYQLLKTKNSYDKAHECLIRAEKGSGLETEPECHKRKRRRNPKFDQTESEESDADDPHLPPPPKAPKFAPNRVVSTNKKSLPRPCPHPSLSLSAGGSACKTASNTKNCKEAEQGSLPYSSPRGLAAYQCQAESPRPPSNRPFVENVLSVPQDQTTSSRGSVNPQSEDFQRLILHHLRKLQEEVKLLQNQAEVTQNLLLQLTKGAFEDMSLPEDIVLPLNNRRILEEVEEKLSNDTELQEKLVKFLSVKGGKTLKDCVRRMLACLFSNDLSRQCNWTGQGQKIPFKQLTLKNIVHRAIRKNPSTREATEGTLQEVVSKFFKGAADRDGGRKQRQNN